MRLIKKICLINSYNYARYLPQCIDSAINQTKPFDEIIIVDDGSKDDSLSIINQYAELYPKLIRPIAKPNAGQLSALNAAAAHIPLDSQIFMLDSDDFYPQDYLESFLAAIGMPVWDVAFVAQLPFDGTAIPLTSRREVEIDNFSFKKTSAIVRARQMWIGNPNTCISMSGSIFKDIFPYEHESDFVTRADDVIVYASSIIGAEKVFVPHVGVGWRVHDSNNTQKIADENWDERQKKIRKLFEFYCNKFALPLLPRGEDYISECVNLSITAKQYLNSLLGPDQEPFH
jgi:glycosyltransferase involved in cell wall biosynthesis